MRLLTLTGNSSSFPVDSRTFVQFCTAAGATSDVTSSSDEISWWMRDAGPFYIQHEKQCAEWTRPSSKEMSLSGVTPSCSLLFHLAADFLKEGVIG